MSDKEWIQKAFSKIKKKGTEGKCTGKKYGSKSCPPGSKPLINTGLRPALAA